MEEVSLVRFLTEKHVLLPVVCPTHKKRVIPAEALVDHIRFENVDAAESTVMFFQSYIQELEDSKKGIFKDVLLFFDCLSFMLTLNYSIFCAFVAHIYMVLKCWIWFLFGLVALRYQAAKILFSLNFIMLKKIFHILKPVFKRLYFQ